MIINTTTHAVRIDLIYLRDLWDLDVEDDVDVHEVEDEHEVDVVHGSCLQSYGLYLMVIFTLGNVVPSLYLVVSRVYVPSEFSQLITNASDSTNSLTLCVICLSMPLLIISLSDRLEVQDEDEEDDEELLSADEHEISYKY